MIKFLWLCLIISIGYSKSNIISEIKTIDKEGNIYIITTICNNGLVYSTVAQTNKTQFSLAQEFEYNLDTNIIQEIKCEQNFNKIKEK